MKTNLLLKKKKDRHGVGNSSVVECLPTMCEALGSSPSISIKRQEARIGKWSHIKLRSFYKKNKIKEKIHSVGVNVHLIEV